MVKNYLKLLVFFAFSLGISAQQPPKIFTISDFNLNGNVKSCTVVTDYGKEIFEFDRKGYLTKSVTQYNEFDQDITVYKYESGILVEKRMESYKNDALDAATSMANFYEIDTTENKIITEKIISYDKIFSEGQQYKFDSGGKLTNILISHLDAVDEVTIERDTNNGETTESYFLNGTLEKSIRTSKKITENLDTLSVVLTKEYIDGEPSKAIERNFRKDGNLDSETLFVHSAEENQFVPLEISRYVYTEENILEKMTTTRDQSVTVREYIFQFDGHEPKNWVKKIITPDNEYTTRFITYYEQEKELVKE